MIWVILILSGVAGAELWLLLRAYSDLGAVSTANAHLLKTVARLTANARIDAKPMDTSDADAAAFKLAKRVRRKN